MAPCTERNALTVLVGCDGVVARLSLTLRYTHPMEETMSHADIIRAWKDPEYRSTLSATPTHPAGLIELPDPELGGSGAIKDRGFRVGTATDNKPTFHFNTKNNCCRF